MPTNFALYESSATAGLDIIARITRPGDTAVADSALLADHTGKYLVTVGNYDSIEITYVAGSAITSSMCVYFSGFDGELPINVSAVPASTTIGTSVEITGGNGKDYFAPITYLNLVDFSFNYNEFASGDAIFNCPFFGGSNLADSITTGYSDGRKYQYNEPLRFQSTKTQNYPEKPASFPKKDFTLKQLSEAEQIECLKFFQRNQGKLVLMVEYGASDRHHYTLGFLDATTNTSQFYNIGEMGFSIIQKHAV